MDDLIHKLQSEQSRYSPAERAVAAYLIEHCRDVPFRSISAVALATGTSETTVSKFCDTLGFSGFSGLKRMLSEQLNSEISMARRLDDSAKRPGKEDIFSLVAQRDAESVHATLENAINRKNAEIFLKMLDQANHIYTTGLRTSSFFADFLAFKLRQQGLHTDSINEGRADYMDRMLLIDQTDLIIAFSFPRYSALVIKILRHMHEKGVPIVLFTDTSLSPAYEYADVIFTCAVNHEAYIPSYTSCFSLINAILMTRSLKNKDHLQKRLGELEQYLTDFHIFFE